MVAFAYGPNVLAGLSGEERSLRRPGLSDPAGLLVHDNEREWGMWNDSFKTVGQEIGLRFVPLYRIGYERYQVYFPIMN